MDMAQVMAVEGVSEFGTKGIVWVESSLGVTTKRVCW